VGRPRSNPFQGFVDVMSEMSRMREMVTDPGFETGQEDQRRTHANAWIPPTDIFAREGNLVIRCELAGVRREDVEITLSDGVLNILGERRSELNEEEVTFYTRERFYGTFRRSMSLPEGVHEDDIDATFEDCVLEITVRRGAAAAPESRRIQIRDKTG
jgi:HSP20 family protein